MAADTGTMDLKKALERQIDLAKEQNTLRGKGGFLTEKFVGELFTVDNIKARLLKRDVDTRLHNHYDIAQLASTIKDEGTKLYAILILLEQSHRISPLLKGSPLINDNSLFGARQTGIASSTCSLDKLKGFASLKDIADEFYEKQWIFPPSLMGEVTFDFHAKYFRFPFTSEPQKLGGGSYGEVFAVDLPRGYLDQHTSIAYKRIRREGRNEDRWKRVQREVQVLQNRPHRNITPLLGSFLAGQDDARSPESKAECLYILSPQAALDMRKWLEKPPNDLGNADDLRRHIYFDTMLGLISGLTFIHREIDGRVGYHRDIKPSNLLLFVEGGSKMWRICDFGSSNLKSIDDTATTNLIATKKWAPPEYFTDKDATDGQSHGRSHDVFSMGCVFLCLATILRWKWDPKGLPEFESMRINAEENKESVGSDDFHKSMTAVHAWVKRLQDLAIRDQDREVLALIDEMLLPREERLFSWEVEVDLFIILDKSSPNEVIEKLREVVQESRGPNLQEKHNVFRRAEQKELAEDGKDKKRTSEFFNILTKNKWYDHSPQATTEDFGHIKPVMGPRSNFPAQRAGDDLCGGQELFMHISQGFKRSDIVALYGVTGVG
ncbi:kinase-like domain-containing protein [Phaeosphaeriaceae sp. PMI808]|nr:kinase-like domain-containing protein [Phaeosphaeriaceae sp. PMI808]